jgi:hypothetical protein
MWATVNLPKMGSDVALGVELGKLEDASVAALAIESVKALKVNQLEVTFNKAVDTTDLTLAVTRGVSAVGVDTTTWNAEKTSVVLETTAKMINGTYNVKATSAADADMELMATAES